MSHSLASSRAPGRIRLSLQSRDYYSTKRLIKDLGLPVEKIDAYKNNCMLYWKDDVNLEYCKFCGDARVYRCVLGAIDRRAIVIVACGRSKVRQCDRPDIHYAGGVDVDLNNLPAYGMASRWSIVGIMGLPVCIDDTWAFHLQHGDLICDWVADFSPVVEQPLTLPSGYGSDHKWTNKSIFWDLPYWATHLIRHNIDVMHIEKNVLDNIFNTMMDIKKKTKDNLNARKDLKIICHRLELKLDKRRPNPMSKVVYTLTKLQKRRICEWIRGLKFFDWYASNIAHCVDMTELRMPDMKSHDCHSICSTTLDVTKLHELEHSFAVIICNLEKIFSLALFDSMEHLIVHLPYEARIGGPVQYRWMYPFERFLHDLKKKMKNKAHVEASTVEAYIVEEIGLSSSHYFEPNVLYKRSRPDRNDDLTSNKDRIELSIFGHSGRASGASKKT
ncbi:UNVERIFIED_CONTAM: hypothetical protein Slati_3882500 [Sesamum latifolium]|uniref:DUF4218 domain-containing protein n=1 Tax=Sesamum latifolium TaxID=2727402 RepID=A0AAW2TQ15_9LAMI